MKKIFNLVFKTLPVKNIIIITIAMVITALDGVIIPQSTGMLIKAGQERDIQILKEGLLLGIVGYSIIRIALYIWEKYQQKNVEYFNKKLKSKIITSFFFQKNTELKKSYIDNILFNDMKVIEQNSIKLVFHFIYCLIFSLVTTIYVLSIDFYIATLFIIFSILPIIAPNIFKKRVVDSTKEWSKSNDELFNKYTEYTAFRKFIALFQKENIFSSRLEKSVADVEKKYYKMNVFTYLSNLVANLLSGLSTYIPLGIGVYAAILGRLEISALLSIYLASDRIISPLLNAIDYYTKIISTKPLIEKIEQLISLDIEKSEVQKGKKISLPIELKNINLSFGKRKIFNGLSLTVNKGEKVLIMGSSGSGKSTLLDIMSGKNIKNLEGEMHYNRVSIDKISRSEILSSIGYFTQEQFVLNDTLRFNLTLGESISDKEIENILKNVGLEYLLDKYSLDSRLERDKISGGEKARLCLARLLLFKYDVLFLDEFSANLDATVRDKIRKMLLESNLTFIEVSHNLPKDISLYDKVYILEENRLKLQ